MPLRIFIALDIADEILDALGQVDRRLDRYGGGIRWVARANRHVTLQFLGDVA